MDNEKKRSEGFMAVQRLINEMVANRTVSKKSSKKAETTSQEKPKTYTSPEEYVTVRLKELGLDHSNVDSNYISSFFKDAKSYLSSVESDYNGMTFNNSSSVYEQRKKKTEDLKERSWNIRQYLDANKDSIGEDSYNAIIANLDEFDKYSTSNDYSFYRKNKYFSQWDSEDAYKTGIMSSAEIKHEYDNRVVEAEKDKGIIFELSRAMVPYDWETAEANGVDRQTWEDIEEKRQYINQKYGVNLHESGYDDINVLNNLYKTLDENDSSIAYTTKDGQNVTWQMLYDQKVAQEDLANRIAEYSGNDDWGELSKGKDFSADPNRESDYNLVWELSLSNIAYDKETALANGASEEEWNDIDRKRRYIGEKYGVDLYSDIYSNTNIFNEIMTMLDDKSWESGELSTQLHEDVIGEQTFTNMRHLTKDEKAVLNYIFNTQGRDAALQWHNSRMNVYQNRANGALTEEMIKAGQDSPFWSSVGSVALNLGSSVEYLVDIFDYMATGEAPNNILSRASSSIRSGVQETIDSDSGDLLYSTFMSGVDSYVASFLPGGFLSLGLSAAAQATNDALDRGAPVGRAVATGIAAGIFEGLFEKVSIGKFKALKEVASVHGKDIAMNMVKSVFTNASEEFATEVANIAYDSFFNGDFSQYETTIRQYMAMGYSEKDAKTMAAKDLGAQVGEAALSGALMGAGFGFIGSSGAMANNANNANKRAARTYNIGKATLNAEGGVDALQALDMDVSGASDSKLAKKANKLTGDVATGDGKFGKAVAGVKNMANSWKTGKAYRAIESTISDKNKTDLAAALKEKGLSEKSAKNLSEAIVASLDGKQLTHFQRSTLELFKGNSKIGEAIAEAFNGADSAINQRISNLSEFNYGIKRGNAFAALDRIASAVSSRAKAIEKTSYEVADSGKAVLDGSEVKLNGLRKTDDGSVMVVTADNQTADPSEVQYPSEGHALIYENYANLETVEDNIVIANMDVADRSTLAMAYDPTSGVAAKAQFLGLNHAYWYGFQGIAMDDTTLPKNSYIKDISEKQRNIAYEVGRKAAEKAANAQSAGIDAAYEKAVEKLGGEEKAKAISKKKPGKVILESGVNEGNMPPQAKASYEMAKIIAKAVGVDIHIFNGMTANGMYSTKTGEIWLNVNANIGGQSMMAFTLGHELVHMAKQWAPAKFKAFADYLLEQYGKKGISVEALINDQIHKAQDSGYELDRQTAYEEVIADACQRMLLDSDAVQKMAEYKNENPSQWQQIIDKIKEFINKIRQVFAGAEPDSMEAEIFKKLDDFAKNELEKRFVDMVMDAGEHLSTIRNAFGKGTVVEVNADGEFTLAKGKDSNGATKFLYNDYTWEKGGRDTLSAALKAEGYSAEDIKAALTIMDGKHDLVKQLEAQFPEQARINQATITTDLKDGHSVLSALVSNGDYPVNIDLLMVCKKRKAYQRVINRLCETGMIQQATVDALAIAEINKILGKYGFETACLGCFVESRRLRIQEWAETIVKEWNSEVKKRNPNAKAFGFGKGEATLTQDEVMQLVGELESHEKNDKGNLNLGQGSAVKRMGVLLDKVPSLRKTLSVEDLITPDGLSSLRSYDSNLFSMVKSRYGSNSPKFVQEFNPYNHELAMYGKVPSEYKSLREYLYAIGGARMQSFSDFIVENWFDYCQIVADLAARKLPMHTYTKEIALAKLFGLTGIKINMSLIPDIDRSLGKEFAGLTRNANGELELIWADKDRYKATGGKSYMQSINFADAIALQNDPRYSANVGTIAVGVSDNHILMMLDDNRIRMIIPYHSSGMNPIFADLMGTSYYKDYTMVQNTTVKQLYNSKGEPVSLKLEKTQNDNLVSGFQFNAVLQELGDARAAAEAYKEWCADASKHTITIKGETYTAELTPKFNDFSGHENYYKLLEDFNTYDCISEQAAPQGDVQQIYPEDFDKILKDELTVQENNRQKQEANQSFDKAMGEIESYLSTHTKADTVFYAEQHGIKLGAKDKKLGAADKAKLADLRKGMKMSMPKVPAPTFYSQMAKVVDGLKQEKHGAASVVSTLRNKGVKAEEIKWSGIESWLEGKKSVTKAELQEFIAGSMLQIEEEELSETVKYTDEERTWLDDLEGDVERHFEKIAGKWPELFGEEMPLDVMMSDDLITTIRLKLARSNLFDTADGKRMVTWAEAIESANALIETIAQDARKRVRTAKWQDYIMPGGENYREIVFKIPGSNYTNRAMKVHWGSDTTGVLAHARIQDMDTFIGHMLFIEEIQSDWHNEGHAKGYESAEYKEAEKISDELFEKWRKIRQAMNKYARSSEFTSDPEDVRKKKWDWYRMKEEEAYKKRQAADARLEALMREGSGTVPDAPFRETYHEYVLKRLIRMAAEQGYDSIGWTTSNIQMDRWNHGRKTNAQMGIESKNPNAVAFEEGYRIEYDQDIPKFLSKYGKKWGTTVGKTVLDNGTEVWSMAITDSMKDSVLYEGQPKYSMPKKRTFTYNELVARGSITGEVIKSSDYVRMKAGLLDEDWLVKRVIRDCKVIQTRSDKPTYYAEVPDIGRNVQVTSEGILHGGGNYKKNNKGVLPPAAVTNNKITVNLVNILRTAIEVNRSRRGSNIDNPFTHIMLGVAGLENADGSVDYYGVRIEIEERVNRDPILVGVNVLGRLKGVNAKKISSPHAQVTDSAGVALATGSFAYNIADLLKDVKKDFDDTFSVDVYRKLKISRKKNDFSENLLFKAHNSHGMSPRQLLADAFDELVQTPDERKLMDQYRNNISKVEGVQERLRKLRGEISKLTKAKGDKAKIAELNKTAKELAELIDKYDRKLLDLEASKPLKDVLARARAAAYQEARQRSEKDLKEYRQQVSERFDRGVENRRKTEMRNKIRRVIRDLDKILNRGDKKRNVKEDMKDFVAEALASAEVLFTDNYTNEDIVRNGFGVELSKEEAKYLEEARKYMDDLANLPAGGFDAWQARQEAEEQLKSKLAYRMSKLKDAFFRERQRLNKAEVAEVLGNLADAYAKLETSEYAYVNGAYHEAVYEYLKMLQEEVGGAKIKDMTIGQLEEMYKAYTMVLTTVRNANKMFADEFKQSRDELANRVMMEVYQAGGEHGLWSKGQLARNQASWNNTKPIYAAERTGSSTFVKLVKGLFKGQYNWATDMEEAKAFRQKVAEKYGFKDWDMEKTYKFTSSSGIEFELNLNQIMSLYAYAKREQAHDHLLKGGFVFGKNTEVVVTKNGIKRTYLNKSAKAHNISDEIMGEIVGKLSNEQKGFVDEMQDYLSTTMGDKGNDVSMRLYGVTLFKERFYFPLRSAGQFKEKAKEAELKQQQGHISIANSGFTKAITPKASNPVVLDGFTDVWAGHVNEMSLYHSMVLPMEDFRRVYNYASPNMEGQESASVNSFIENAYGDAATGYFDQLYKELNGGAIVDPRENLAKQMIGRFKKSAVMLSNSVWVQQFSAIGRAIALIDPKYFVGQKVDKQRHAALWAEMKQYAPVAIIKEMGGFDTHTGLSAKDYLLSEEYGKGERIKGVIKDKQYRDELMGLLPAKADELTWCAIWEAVKRETKAKNPTLDVKSEEFLKKAGERFSDIIEKTQVYDSVLARSANMRSKQGLMQMLTAFMAEPTTTVNMIEDALRKGDKKTIARTFGAAAVSIILNNALASLVYAMRDDDEDETFLEKYAQAFASGMLDDINPMTYYPILKDIWSLLQGYDVERTDMAIYSDLTDSLKKGVTLISKYDSEMDDEEAAKYYKDVTDALMGILDAGASAFGIPWKNVRRDLMSYYNTFNTFMRGDSTTWNSFVDAVGGAALDSIPVAGWVSGESNTDKLYDAIISGDTAYVDRLKSGYKDEDAYSTAVRKALRDNDPRVKEAALAQINGNPSERVRIAKLIMEDGFSQDDVVRAINAEINAMTPNESTSAKKEKGFYTAEDFAMEIANGDQATANAARSDIIQTAQNNGKTQKEAEEAFVSSAKSELGELYTSGNISVQKLTSALKTYCGMDDDEVYWQIDKWDYAKATGSTDGYGKYNDFHAAVQTGKDLKTVIKTYTDNGVEAKTLASEITSHFKPLYREMSNNERASIKGYLLNAYALLGYDRSKKSKDIDKWLED